MDNITRLGDMGNNIVDGIANDVRSKVISPVVNFMGKQKYMPAVMMQKPNIDIRPFLNKIRIV
jgi:hypothetical protein